MYNQNTMEEITQLLSLIDTNLKHKIKQHLFDDNTRAENFACTLLNMVYDWDLGNLNVIEHMNYPALDLGSKPQENSPKIGVQVTTTTSKKKITDTLEKTITHHVEQKYDHIYFFVLGTKEKDYQIDMTNYPGLIFDQTHVIDFPTLENVIATLDYRRQDEILAFLHESVGAFVPVGKLKEMEDSLASSKSLTMRNPSLYSNFVPNANEVIGREKELTAIKSLLDSQSASLVSQNTQAINRIVTIRGIGGSGKSVLAKEYAKKHKSDYKYIIEASTDAFKSAVNLIPIANADQQTGLTDYNQLLIFLREEFSKHKTLLIIHDYNTNDDPDFHNWLSFPCDIILTTWNHLSCGKELYLDPKNLSTDDAIAIMRYYYLLHASDNIRAELETTFDSDLASVKDLVLKVQRHPLTIKLLACQMNCLDDELMSPSQMLAELEAEGLQDKQYFNFTHTHVAGDKTESQNTTAWQHLANVYAKAIEKEKIRLSSDQMEALRYMTLVGPVHGISKSRFEKWTGLSRLLLNDLERRGWIQYDKDNIDYLDSVESRRKGTYHMPMMIGEILHQMNGLNSMCDNTNSFIDNWRTYKIDNLIGYEIRSSFLEQSMILAEYLQEEEKEDYVSLLDLVGYIIYCAKENFAQQQKALIFQEKALKICLMVFGENHASTAETYNNLGMSYSALGELEKGLEYFEKALEIRRKVLGENHVDTATSYNNVGGSYMGKGEHEKGLKYSKKALELRLEVLGENHADTATSYNNVGGNYTELGEHEKGLEYFEKALEIRRKVLGENHTFTATSYNNVGMSYEAMGKIGKGLEYQEKALEIRRKVLGENHTSTATSYNNVASSYYEKGNLPKAIVYMEKAYNIYNLIMGENHSRTGLVKENLDYLKSL